MGFQLGAQPTAEHNVLATLGGSFFCNIVGSLLWNMREQRTKPPVGGRR